jgi:TRAP-type C4-dicarboxylate transport system substrate-binding protein
MRHAWIVLALALAVAGLPPGELAAQPKPIELKFSSWVATVHGHHTGVMVPWARMVEEKSGGRLKITIYPGSTLGKATDHYDLIKDGIADMGFTTPGYTPGRFPLITVTELPLLFKTSRGGSLAVMSIFDKHFKTEFKDVKVLWFWVHPPGHFHLARKPVKVLEDLAGLKIRAATPMLTTMVKTLGAIPVSIPAPDTYTALERGTVDGTIFPWEAISSFKIAEVLKHHVASGLYVAPLFTFMNLKKYESLPPDLRKVIDDLSGAWGAEFNGKVWDQNELVGIEAIKKAGGTIYTLPAEERQRWAAKLKPVEEEWLKSMEAKGLPGRQLLQDLREAIKRYDP